MVKVSNGKYLFGTHFHSWQNGEMVKKINNTMNCMVRFNCSVGYQLCLSLLGFDQNANDGYPDEYGTAQLCYLWYLLVYVIFWHVTSKFSPIAKWCNGEMIPDSAVIMVRLFCHVISILVLE